MMFLQKILLFCAAVAKLSAAKNLNGNDYVVTVTDKQTSEYNSDYASKGHDFFDVYSPPITTQYGQVYWTMQEPVELPASIVARFSNSTIAITGYEVDQVIKGTASDGSDDVSVPITHAYNHHYGAWLSGEDAELVAEPCKASEHMWMMRADGLCPVYRTKEKRGKEKKKKGKFGGAVADIPTSQFFSEGNGGEFRKSFHGYPAGTAQLLDKPRVFTVSPMQIDTFNRDFPNSTQFVAGPLPREAQGPPNGGDYSPLLECPCTDRLYKNVDRTWTTRVEGSCDETAVQNETDCFTAIEALLQDSGFTVVEKSTVADESLPRGCLFMPLFSSSTQVKGFFNTLPSSSMGTECGATAGGSEPSLVFGSITEDFTGITVAVSLRPDKNLVNITISGPATGYLGVGFGARQMGDLPYAIIVAGGTQDEVAVPDMAAKSGDGVFGKWNVTERKLDDHAPGKLLTPTVTVLSHTVTTAGRTVTLSRKMDLGENSDYYTFDVSEIASINLITALGYSPNFGYHKAHGNIELPLVAIHESDDFSEDSIAATCVCVGETLGEICGNAVGRESSSSRSTTGKKRGVEDAENCIAFPTSGEQMGEGQPMCPEQPTSDLHAFGNPTCDVTTYVGGLRCCHHLNTLLDADQIDPWPNQPLEYSLKFRFWFEDFVSQPLSPTMMQVSHKDLLRLYWQTESFAGEYDVPQGNLGLPGTEWNEDAQIYTYTITSEFKASEMLYDCPSEPPNCGYGGNGDDDLGITGVELVYAAPHCHAPSCLFMELWDADRDELICRVEPIRGSGRTDVDKFDEKEYATIPPCLWGSSNGEEDDGGLVLPRRPFLSFNTTLQSVCSQNSTYGHYGQMASWQMRGYLS